MIKFIDEDEGLKKSLNFVILLSGLSMIILLVLVNRLVYQNLFKPFYLALSKLKSFNVSDQKKIELPTTTTAEFSLLNNELQNMSQKIIDDYISVKEFTENISHEIQTPLAVISSKIEMCLQDENLSENQAALLSEAMKKIKRLSSINQSLIMLTKLQSNIYDNQENIDIAATLNKRLNFFSDFFTDKEINLKLEINNSINITMNVALADILLDNLIKNAIKYNFKKGTILISIKQNSLTISNTGNKPLRNLETYFERFVSDGNSESMGLGLAIVKKICITYGIYVTYIYENNLHTIRLQFNKGIYNT